MSRLDCQKVCKLVHDTEFSVLQVAAVVVLKKDKNMELAQLREWCKLCLPAYAIPTKLEIVEAIPRNQMDKINKKELLKKIFSVKENVDNE